MPKVLATKSNMLESRVGRDAWRISIVKLTIAPIITVTMKAPFETQSRRLKYPESKNPSGKKPNAFITISQMLRRISLN